MTPPDAPRKGRGRHVAEHRPADTGSEWDAPLPPAAAGAVPVMQPPETLPTGIDLSDLARTAYVEHYADPRGTPGQYPSRRALRAAEAAVEAASAAPPGGVPPAGRTAVDVEDHPGGYPPGPDGRDRDPGDAEASGDGGSSGGDERNGHHAGGSGDAPGGTASLMRSSALMAAGTLVSRLLGMGRSIVLAWVIGYWLTGDAFNTANTIPNNLYILVAGGALNAVLVPQISRAMQRGEEGRVFVDRLLSVSAVALAVVSIVLTAAAPLFVMLYGARNWPSEVTSLAVAFAFWCIPQVFFYGLYTLLGQVLNARGSFGPYMWAPVVNNVVAILGMLSFVAVAGADPTGKVRPVDAWSPGLIALLAGTATLGVAAQALVLVPVLRRSGFRFTFRWGLRGAGLGGASRVAGWTFAAVLVAQLGYLVASQTVNSGGAQAALGGKEGAGSLVYASAYLIFVLPHSLVAVSIVTAIFTRMSRAAAQGRTDDVRADLSLALRTVGVATVIASAGFLVLGRDLAFAMFGASGRAQTDVVGWTATVMGIGLVAYSAQYLSQRVFYAYEDARTPFLIQLAATGVWVLGLLAVAVTLDGKAVVLGAGLALAVSLVVGAFLSLVLVRRHLQRIDAGAVVRTHVRLLVGAVLAAVAGWSVSLAMHGTLGEGRPVAALNLLASGLMMVLIYGVVLKLLRVRELDDLLSPLVGRLRRG